MRKVDNIFGELFKEGTPKNYKSTAIREDNGSIFMELHGNRIAARPKDDLNNLTLNLPVRWQTQTTKSRINGIFNSLGFPLEVKSIKGIWFFIKDDGTKLPVVNGINFIHK